MSPLDVPVPVPVPVPDLPLSLPSRDARDARNDLAYARNDSGVIPNLFIHR
jgi:hypothetical protein